MKLQNIGLFMFTEMNMSIGYLSTLFFLLFIMASIINMGRLLGKKKNFVNRGKKREGIEHTCRCPLFIIHKPNLTLKCIFKSCLHESAPHVFY